jgi:hypothetical protein
MTINAQKEANELLIMLANSVIDRKTDRQILFTSTELEVATAWVEELVEKIKKPVDI